MHLTIIIKDQSETSQDFLGQELLFWPFCLLRAGDDFILFSVQNPAQDIAVTLVSSSFCFRFNALSTAECTVYHWYLKALFSPSDSSSSVEVFILGIFSVLMLSIIH